MPNRPVQKQRRKTPYAQFEKVLDSLLDVVCIIDLEGRFVQVNRSAQAVWGYSPEALAGTFFMDLIAPEDRFKAGQVWQLLLSGVEVSNFENHCLRRDGSRVLVNWSCRHDEDGLLYAIARDKSGEKSMENLQLKYERRLKQQNRQIYDMLERIKEGFLALDQDWRVVFWNRQAEVITGRRREEVLTQSIWDAFPEALMSNLHREIRRAMQDGAPAHFEGFYKPMRMWLEISAYPTEGGLTMYFKDITERKHAELELRKLSRVAEQTVNSVILTDAREHIIWVNEGFTRITGYTFEEAVGKVPSQLLQGPETDPETIAYIREQKRKREPFQTQVISYKKNGETYWSDVTCEPLFDAQGVLQQYFSIEIDITDKMRLQQQLEKEKEEQQKRLMAAVNKAQEEERAQVSQELHDNVNQVLTTVKLYTELCLGGIGNREELLHKSMQLLQDSINEIRSLSKRLSAPSLGNIKLKDSISELVEAISATNKLRILFESNIGSLDVSAELHITIYRILQEHLTNVLKHAAATTVQIRIDRAGGELCLRVADDGCGFDTAAKRQGIGITNMISRAESLGGKLCICSQPGQGCSLEACFPFNPTSG